MLSWQYALAAAASLAVAAAAIRLGRPGRRWPGHAGAGRRDARERAAVRPVRAVAVRRFFHGDGQVGGTVPGALAVGCRAVAAPAQRDGPAAAPAAPSAA